MLILDYDVHLVEIVADVLVDVLVDLLGLDSMYFQVVASLQDISR